MSLVQRTFIDNEVKVQVLREGAYLPHQAHNTDAGYDLYASLDEDIIIRPGTCEKIGTGLAMTCPQGYYGAIVPRSGMGINRGLRPANTPGTVDEGYTGEWIVALYNDSAEDQIIHPGDRIAQVVFLPYLNVEFKEVSNLGETNRGTTGFGASGTN